MASTQGFAEQFFRDAQVISKPLCHSEAAAKVNACDAFAAHFSNNSSTIWYTISPDDTMEKSLFRIAGEIDNESYPTFSNLPPAEKRYRILYNRPAAAALGFEYILELIMKYVVGWNEKKNRPYRRGGFFGIPKAWIRVVQEQSRLTLHVHILIWCVEHSSIQKQFWNAMEKDLELEKQRIEDINISSNIQ